LIEFSLENNIKIKYATNYYPQGNGLAESTNKNMIKILKKTITDHQRSWHLALPNSLWVDRVTPKESLGNYPLFLHMVRNLFYLPISSFLPCNYPIFPRRKLSSYATHIEYSS
jgi:hypothetical protein